MYIQYNGLIDERCITEIVERVLDQYGVEDRKEAICREILSGLEDFFMECSIYG